MDRDRRRRGTRGQARQGKSHGREGGDGNGEAAEAETHEGKLPIQTNGPFPTVPPDAAFAPVRTDDPRSSIRLAVLTGLEPATSALTGRRALQLLHRTSCCVPPTGFEPVLPP